MRSEVPADADGSCAVLGRRGLDGLHALDYCSDLAALELVGTVDLWLALDFIAAGIRTAVVGRFAFPLQTEHLCRSIVREDKSSWPFLWVAMPMG